MKTETLKRLPGVLSFNRGLVLSDAELFNIDQAGMKSGPVKVIRHGIRGTQNVNKKGEEGSTANNAEHKAVSNVQTTDTAKLSETSTGMMAQFDVRFLPLSGSLAACAHDTDPSGKFRDSLEGFIKKAINSDGVKEVAIRYARNIANGRWLWRNRTIASKIKIVVAYSGESVSFDALATPMNHFDNYSTEERLVGAVIAAALSGEYAETLHVTAEIDFGIRGAVEVFPSQNYIDYGKKKPEGFARSLYHLGNPEKTDEKYDTRIMGAAALRDQKVSNALRTIDTWFEGFEDLGKPIPVEPMGANIEQQIAYRSKESASSFGMMKRLGLIEPSSSEGMFVIACLIRGGVYSEKDLDAAAKKKASKAGTEKTDESSS